MSLDYARARRRLNSVIVLTCAAAIGLFLRVFTDTDLRTAALVGAGLVWLAGLLTVTYWPTRRPPGHLYHYTSRVAADRATLAHHDDGTVTIRLVPRRRRVHRWLPIRPKVYFFHRPVRRRSLLYNVAVEPEVCIELTSPTYRGRARRRLTGAVAIGGVVEGRATINPLR